MLVAVSSINRNFVHILVLILLSEPVIPHARPFWHLLLYQAVHFIFILITNLSILHTRPLSRYTPCHKRNRQFFVYDKHCQWYLQYTSHILTHYTPDLRDYTVISYQYRLELHKILVTASTYRLLHAPIYLRARLWAYNQACLPFHQPRNAWPPTKIPSSFELTLHLDTFHHHTDITVITITLLNPLLSIGAPAFEHTTKLARLSINATTGTLPPGSRRPSHPLG